MRTHIDLTFLAPIPVGHHVSVLALERLVTPTALFGDAGPPHWEPIDELVVCDETTRIVYADNQSCLRPGASSEQLVFSDGTRRIAQARPAMRGTIVSCVVLSDHGSSVYPRTYLGIDIVPAGAS